jgi:hypothetical protein
LDLTPRQFQAIIEKMRVRRHNNRAFQYHLHNFKISGTEADFIDLEMESMIKEMSKNQANQRKAHLDLLESQKKAENNG